MINTTLVPTPTDAEQAGALPATDAPRFFWKIEYGPPSAGRAVLVATNGNAIEPCVHESPMGHICVGAEQGVFVVDIATGATLARITDTTFVQSIDPCRETMVLVSAEDELILIGNDGRVRWRHHFPDVIVSVQSDGARLCVTDMSDTRYTLDLESGAESH